MSKKSIYPVFYDPQHRRWNWLKRTVQLLGIGLAAIVSTLLVSLFIHPVLPNLGLSPVHPIRQVHQLLLAKHSLLTPNSIFSQHHLKHYLANTRLPFVTAASQALHKKSEVVGFYVNWDDNSFSSLKHNISRLDKLIPEWLHLKSADGDLIIDDLTKQTRALAYIRQHRPNLAIAPLINNYDSKTQSWDDAKLAEMLANSAARDRTIQNLLEFVRSNGFAGISIDVENIPASSQPQLQAFMQELYAKFHPLGLEVSQSVPLDDPDFDYRTLAQFTDYLILMAYDEHYSTGEAGPVASQRWYADKLRQRFAELPANQYIVALGNYGYDWKHQTTSGDEVTFQQAIKTAQDSAGQIIFDPTSLNPTLDYYDNQNTLHHVWFLDAITTFNQMVEGQRDGARGFALWRLGAEDPAVWDVFDRRTNLDQAAAQTLRTVHYGYDIDYEGQGEVLKVTETPQDGVREITYDRQTGLIIDQHLISYPSPYTIERWGGENKTKIALTFDDGPDPNYTPQILEVLDRYHVPATFFIIGLNASLNPDLLKQIVDRGHEIGSHTFTHPNVSTTSDEQLEIELNATERLFESQVGRRSVLFRPPYAEDVEPETPDQVKPLLFTGSDD